MKDMILYNNYSKTIGSPESRVFILVALARVARAIGLI